MIKDHIFRAYDIRGIVDEDFDEKGAHQIGRAYATYLLRNTDHPLKVVVGRDGRKHSPRLQKAFIEGVRDCGVSVVDIGLSTSPLLNFSICYGQYDGGVNITASHNPKEFNGFKLQKEGAHSIFGDQIQEIKKIIDEKSFYIAERQGYLEEKNFTTEWLNKLASLVKINGKPKIVVDTGNGVAGAFAEQFFEKLNTDFKGLYLEVDGDFPNHEANPEVEETLADLKRAVIKEGAILGIAFDGDGDRVGIIDNEGKHYAADMLLLLLARELLEKKPNSTVVYDLKASSVLIDDIVKRGGKAVPCKTGHSFVENKMLEEGALLGGEVSGHMFFADNYYGFDDAFLAAAKILEAVSKHKKPLKEHFTDLSQTFVTPELKIKVTEEKKFAVMEQIVQYFSEKYPENSLTIDGVKVDFDDGSWGIVRASNTSPYLTLRFEARTADRLEALQREFFDHLKTYPELDGIPEKYS